MSGKKIKILDEKSLLYKLCDFLYKKRLDTKGVKGPVKILAKDLVLNIGEYADASDDRARLVKIIDELNDLIEYAEDERGGKLIKLKDGQTKISGAASMEMNKALFFIYSRAGFEYYTKQLKIGDQENNYWNRNSKVKVKVTKKFLIDKGRLIFNTESIPVERKQLKIAELFFRNPEIHKLGKKTKYGEDILLQEIQDYTDYKPEKSARTGMKSLKEKINNTWDKSLIDIKRGSVKKSFRVVINY